MDTDDLTITTIRDGAVCTLIVDGDLDITAASGFLQHASRVVGDRTGRFGCFLVLRRDEEHFAARGIRVEHGNAGDLRGKGPEIALLHEYGMNLGVAFKITPKTVLRGSYGEYFWTMPLSQLLQASRTNPPLNLRFQNICQN